MVIQKYVALMFFIGADIFSGVLRIVYPLTFALLAIVIAWDSEYGLSRLCTVYN